MKWNDAKVRGEESMRSQLGSLWKGRMNFRTRLDQMRFIRDGHLSEVKTQQNESIRYTKTDFTPENIDLQIKLNWKFLLKLSLGLWKITSYALSITTSRILQGKPPLNSVEISLLVASALISCRSRRLRHRPLESLPNSKAEGRRILFRTVNRGLLSRVDSRTIISTRSRTPHFSAQEILPAQDESARIPIRRKSPRLSMR